MNNDQKSADPLSALARKLLRLNAADAYSRLTVNGDGNPEATELLAGAAPAQLLSVPVKSQDDASGLLAALYLWHDCLDEAHRIAQASPTATGAFWHAIMHRREGDFSNSKYWYARSPNHPALQVIAAQANPVLNPLPADKSLLRLTHDGWNPIAFVDFVEQASGEANTPRHQVAIALQQLEWRVLFDHCTRQAAG